MQAPLDALAAEPWDVLVVGGGIVGAAAARDAALRGLKVGLVEARDFASGTSGATTRLAHGGLRYLERLDIAQVREGLRERAWLLQAAPHLVKPLPFLLPLPRAPLLRAKLRAGLALYDALAPGGWPKRSYMDPATAARLEPALRPDAMAAAAGFHDGQVLSPERLVVEFALAAKAAGAAVANHARVVGLGRAGSGWQATVRDEAADRTVDVRAQAVLNCAGPWVGQLAGLAGVSRTLVRTTRGTHVAFPNFLGRALAMRAEDGRTFFAIPWNEVTLVGTTDLDETRDPGEAAPSADEVRYLLEQAAPFVRLPDTPAYTTVGVRAMLPVEGVAPGAVPRGHAVVDHAHDGLPGFFSVVGGKLTTARATAAGAVDAVAHALGRALPPAAAQVLPGAHAWHECAPLVAEAKLSATLTQALGLYGGRVMAPLVEGPVLCERHLTRGMVRVAVQEEWCRTLPDLMFRRSLAGHAPDLGAHCAAAASEAMAELLGWDPATREAQLRAYEAEAAQRLRGLPSPAA